MNKNNHKMNKYNLQNCINKLRHKYTFLRKIICSNAISPNTGFKKSIGTNIIFSMIAILNENCYDQRKKN